MAMTMKGQQERSLELYCLYLDYSDGHTIYTYDKTA